MFLLRVDEEEQQAEYDGGAATTPIHDASKPAAGLHDVATARAAATSATTTAHSSDAASDDANDGTTDDTTDDDGTVVVFTGGTRSQEEKRLTEPLGRRNIIVVRWQW